MTTGQFIQGAEVWLPGGDCVTWGTGAYTTPGEPPRTTSPRRYRYGEGLPGAAWASRRALLWKDAPADSLRARLSPMKLETAIGIPCFLAERLIGVLTLLLNPGIEETGCIELWQMSPSLDVMKFETGLYWSIPEFENLSRLLQFPRGTGLPGLVWQSGESQFMVDVASASTFVRATLAERAGLKFGLGLPVTYDGVVVQALTCLSNATHPFVIAFEMLKPKPYSISTVARVSSATGASELRPDISKVFDALSNTVALHGAPAVSSHASGIAVAFPIYDAAQLLSVACIAFA